MAKSARDYLKGKEEKIVESHGSSAFHMLLARFAGVKGQWRDRILKNQKKDGSFDCICSGRNSMVCLQNRQAQMMAKSKSPAERELHEIQGRAFVTAIYCVLLQDGLKILAKEEK